MLSLIFGAILLFFNSWICLFFLFKPPDEGYEAFFLYLVLVVGGGCQCWAVDIGGWHKADGCAVDVVDDNEEEIIYYFNV